MLKAGQLDRNIPGYVHLCITDERNFDEDKQKLISLIQQAFIKGPAILVKYPHPYFATFKTDEWAQLNWMHLDHHLRQFGV